MNIGRQLRTLGRGSVNWCESGDQVIICDLVVDRKRVGHLLQVALECLGEAIKTKYSHVSIIIKHNFHD